MYGLGEEWNPQKSRDFSLDDYMGGEPRWCPGCGDHGVLTTVQRVIRDSGLPPEKVVVVSGIGCSSRFPHYMKTYGFHSLHGRALPVACGIKSRRPDLEVFVITGDGDNCAIGTGHWIHALRYNMNLTILMLDNNIYGLTKAQTSPTTERKALSKTHPSGSFFVPLNPISVMLGITNRSFVAQSVDWQTSHLYETIKAARLHKGSSFVRILQRCPHYTPHAFDLEQNDTSNLVLLNHPDGVMLPESQLKRFSIIREHDPSDLQAAREMADKPHPYHIGVFFKDDKAERYDLVTRLGKGMTTQEKVAAVEKTLDLFTI